MSIRPAVVDVLVGVLDAGGDPCDVEGATVDEIRFAHSFVRGRIVDEVLPALRRELDALERAHLERTRAIRQRMRQLEAIARRHERHASPMPSSKRAEMLDVTLDALADARPTSVRRSESGPQQHRGGERAERTAPAKALGPDSGTLSSRRRSA